MAQPTQATHDIKTTMNSLLPPPLLTAIFFCALGMNTVSADILSDINSKQIASLEKGQQVSLPEKIPGKPWPRENIYSYVKASPEEVMAVFADYDNAHRFVPNVQKSEIVKVLHPWEKEVYYEIALPVMLPNECYTSRIKLSASPGRDWFKASWVVPNAKFIKSGKGSLIVQAHAGGSILCYTNLVDPGSKIAVILRGPSQKQMRDVVTAICKEVLRMKQKQPDQLKALTESLQKSLPPS